jgi:predicted Zn-dependent protease
MLKWLSLLVDDAATAEAKLLRQLLKESPECPDWSLGVQPVLRRLVEQSRIRRPIVCKVLAMPVFNALALPHKTIVLSQLLVDFCRDLRDQVAFVLAHEVAHIHLGHARKRTWANAVMGVVPLANPLLGLGIRMLLDVAYSREQEFEADNLAVKMLARAGYSPFASIALLERLAAASTPGNLVSDLLGSHPPMNDRVKLLREAVRTYT